MACDSGQGGFIGMTVTQDAFGATGAGAIAVPQAHIRLHTDAVTVVKNVIARSFSEWTVTQEVFDAPRIEDGHGAFRRKRYGCDRDHSSWTAVIEYNGTYDLSTLVGAEGTIRRTNPDGSYWQGAGRIVRGTPFPAQSSDAESLGEIEIQWTGGSTTDPAYTSA